MYTNKWGDISINGGLVRVIVAKNICTTDNKMK